MTAENPSVVVRAFSFQGQKNDMMQAIPTGGGSIGAPTPTMTPGRVNFGLVPVANVEALESRRMAEEEARRQAENETRHVITSLSAHLSKLLALAKQAKQPIERQMLINMRQRAGVYESDKLAAIRQMGGSEAYVLLTATKCRAAEAWINDTLRPVSERPWTISPTPLPELPPDVEEKIKADTDSVLEEVLAQMAMAGEQFHPAHLAEEIRKYESELRDQMQVDIEKEAKRRAERMAQKIDDQLTEGGWHAAFWAVISDLVTLKAGILKAPVIRRRKSYKWVQTQGGEWEIQAKDVLVPEFDRVSPFDLYPAPGSRGVNDGYLFERHHMTRSTLESMIGVPGYSEENIRKALSDYGESGKREHLPTDSERAQLEFGQTDHLLTGTDKIEAWEFWGSVPGSMLLEWGMKGDIDPEREYEINAWQVGDHTIRALLNPDQLNRKPYSVDSFERVPGAFWGKGIPELMADIQDVCNAVARAMVNNAGLASGPQVEVNKDRCSDNEEIWPWKIWQATTDQMNDSPAVRFHQPQVIVDSLLRVYNTFSLMADDQTGVPRWSHGNTNVGGAGETSSGLSMLMTSAARGIKEVISHIDTMTSGAISRVYDYNMLYDPDPSIKGDAKVVARGSSSLLAKEQKLVRTNEFLALTGSNPIDMQILGVKARQKLLKSAAELLELDIADEMPSGESEIAEIMEMISQWGMAGGGQQQAPGPAPRTTDAAGAPAGGTDNNTNQNPKGVTP